MNHPPSPCDRMATLVVMLGLTVLAAMPAAKANAQVLNEEVSRLLANNCAGLGTGGFPTPTLKGFGPNLAALCNTPQTQGAIAGGGGAASVQGSTASVLNRALLSRLESLRNECGTEEQAGDLGGCAKARFSSLEFNPLELLALGTFEHLGVSSPFVTSSSTGAGSTAAFEASTLSRWNGFGLFGSGVVESLNRDTTRFQDGYTSMVYGFSGGIDYRINRRAVLGFVGTYSNIDGTFRAGGTFSTNSYGGLLFTQLLPADRTFMQVTAGYTRNNYLVNRLATATVRSTALGNDRTISAFASSNSGGNVAHAGFLAGYDQPWGRLTFGPRAGVQYTQTLIGSYAEEGGGGIGLRYDSQAIHSLQSTVGLQVSMAYSTAFGVLVHQVNADYIHEFANSQRHITVQFTEDQRAHPTRFSFQNEAPGRDYGYVGTGLVAVLPNGWQPFINFRAMVGHSQFNSYAGTFGLRIER